VDEEFGLKLVIFLLNRPTLKEKLLQIPVSCT